MAVSETITATPGAASDLSHIPGTGRLPVFGNTFEFIRDPFAFHRRRIEAFGPVYRFSVFGGWTVALNGAEGLELGLMDKERIFSSKNGWDVLERLFSGGLMLRDFEDHRAHRRVMQAAFKPGPMEDYVGRMNDGIALAMQRWADNPSFKFYDGIKRLTLDLGASVFLGVDMGPEAQRLNQAFIDEVSASIAVIRKPWPGTKMGRGVRSRAFLRDYFRSLIAERRRAGGDDMFSQLCRAESEDGRMFSDDEIIDHMNFLLMAAHDTTTSALTTMAWALASYPDWQETVRKEVQELGGDRLAYADMAALEISERVFKEALRFKPPVPFIPRYAVAPFSYGGYDIPAETSVVLTPGLTMMDPALWTDPEQFDPDRFSPNRAEDQSHRFAWAPFGGGAHKCIGMHFAVMQVKAFTFQFLRQYRISLPAGYQPRWQPIPIPKPRDGLPVRIERI